MSQAAQGFVSKLQLRCRNPPGLEEVKERRGDGACLCLHGEGTEPAEGHQKRVDVVRAGRHAGLWTTARPSVGGLAHDSFSNFFSVPTVDARDFPWTSTLSMLYVDNPVSARRWPAKTAMSASRSFSC